METYLNCVCFDPFGPLIAKLFDSGYTKKWGLEAYIYIHLIIGSLQIAKSNSAQVDLLLYVVGGCGAKL